MSLSKRNFQIIRGGLILFLGLPVFLIGCDPHPSMPTLVDIYVRDSVLQLKDTINLGDTVAFYLKSDTVNYNNTIAVRFTDGVSFLGSRYSPLCVPYAVDSTLPVSTYGIRVATQADAQQLLQLPTRTDSLINNLVLPSTNGMIAGYYKLVPQHRGAFFVWGKSTIYTDIAATSTYNSYIGQCTFGNINKHIYLLMDNTTIADNINQFLLNTGGPGNDIYAFYVK